MQRARNVRSALLLVAGLLRLPVVDRSGCCGYSVPICVCMCVEAGKLKQENSNKESINIEITKYRRSKAC